MSGPLCEVDYDYANDQPIVVDNVLMCVHCIEHQLQPFANGQEWQVPTFAGRPMLEIPELAERIDQDLRQRAEANIRYFRTVPDYR